MANLEQEADRVWNSDIRPLVDEAVRCYNAGAIRAAIASTWTAVTADLIDKIGNLAESGDGDAQKFWKDVEAARSHGIKPEGVRAMQKVEDKLLATAEALQIIDSINVRELERIREDRNLCVHPSIRYLGEIYIPQPESARSHLMIALSVALTHPPTQGRKAIDQFTNYICDRVFMPTSAHIQTTFFDRVRPQTRANIIKVAAKHAVLGTAVPPEVKLSADTVADRMAEALKVFALRDRSLVRQAVQSTMGTFRSGTSAGQLQALRRLGDEDFFWDAIDAPLAARLDDLLTQPIPVDDFTPLSADLAAIFNLVKCQVARTRLPQLQKRYPKLPRQHRMDVASAGPDRFFVPTVIDFMRDVGSWRGAEEVGRALVISHGALFTAGELQEILSAWRANSQARQAAGMPAIAEELLSASSHLGKEAVPIWQSFLEEVRDVEPAGSPYRYPNLDEALNRFR